MILSRFGNESFLAFSRNKKSFIGCIFGLLAFSSRIHALNIPYSSVRGMVRISERSQLSSRPNIHRQLTTMSSSPEGGQVLRMTVVEFGNILKSETRLVWFNPDVYSSVMSTEHFKFCFLCYSYYLCSHIRLLMFENQMNYWSLQSRGKILWIFLLVMRHRGLQR